MPGDGNRREPELVHPDSNLIITSGSDSITLLDVERAPGAVTTASETLTLSSEITVSLDIGPDGIFSRGITVVAACDSTPSPSPSPTTTETPSPTPSEAPTESPSPSPTELSGTVTHTTARATRHRPPSRRRASRPCRRRPHRRVASP